MSLTRAACRLVCRVMLGVLLFARLAVAGYACPGLASLPGMPAGGEEVMAVSLASTAHGGCGQIDEQAANLCAEHCHAGHQSADTPPAPAALAADLNPLYSIAAIEPAAPGDWRSLSPVETRPAAATPPHAILHCVLRT